MEAGNNEVQELQDIKIQGSHAFIALFKSVISESSFSMSSDRFILTVNGMKSTLEKFGYNLDEDWSPFVDNVLKPILQEMKESNKKKSKIN